MANDFERPPVFDRESGQWVEAGAFIRGSLRTELTKGGIRFTETKSLTRSVFTIEEPAEVYQCLLLAISNHQARRVR